MFYFDNISWIIMHRGANYYLYALITINMSHVTFCIDSISSIDRAYIWWASTASMNSIIMLFSFCRYCYADWLCLCSTNPLIEGNSHLHYNYDNGFNEDLYRIFIQNQFNSFHKNIKYVCEYLSPFPLFVVVFLLLLAFSSSVFMAVACCTAVLRARQYLNVHFISLDR